MNGNARRDLYGDPGPVSINGRIQPALMGTFRSTYGPTATHLASIEIAESLFTDVKVRLGRYSIPTCRPCVSNWMPMAFPGPRDGVCLRRTERMINGSTTAGRFVAPLLLLLSPSLLANGAAMSLDDYEDMDRTMESVIVTATRMEESLLEVAEAVSVISDEDIRRLAPEMLAEMMRGVPGAFFQQTTPGQGIPIIRGLKGSQVLHLVDGMRLNNAFFRNAPNQYLGLVDAYATERTEVVRGSAPSLYGADAMGGVVQVLTREPGFEGQDWQVSGRLYGSYNSVDSSVIGRAEAATGHENSVLSGGVTWQDHGNREAGGGESIRPSGYEVRAADLKWRQNIGDHSELMLSAQYLEQPESPRVDELVPGYGQQNPPPSSTGSNQTGASSCMPATAWKVMLPGSAASRPTWRAR